MLDWVFGRRKGAKKRRGGPTKKKPSYEEAKRIAAQGDAKARADLASHEDLEPEFLLGPFNDLKVPLLNDLERLRFPPIQRTRLKHFVYRL